MNTCYPPLPAWEQVRRQKPLPAWYVRFSADGEVTEDEKRKSRQIVGGGRPPKMRKRIIALLEEDRNWMTVKEIAAALGESADSLRETIHRCEMDGFLQRRQKKTGFRNLTYEYTVPSLEEGGRDENPRND